MREYRPAEGRSLGHGGPGKRGRSVRLGDPEVGDGWVNGRTVVLSGASVITMGPDRDLVGDIVIRDDRIVALGIGVGADAPDDALRIDTSTAVAIPGLVDGHVHAWEGALRGVSPDSGFYDYMTLTHGMLGPLMTPEDIAIGQRVTALRALEQGVTTIIDNCHNSRSPEHSDAAVEALKDTGIRAVHAVGVGFGQPADNVHENLLRLGDRFGSDPRITLRLMEVAPTLEGWRFAKEHGFGAVAEFGFWTEGIDQLLASGLAGPHLVLDHCAGLSDEQWKAVAASGAAVALVPRSDPHYGLGAVTPVLATNRHGIQEAISSDNEFEYGLDLFSEMRTLMAVQRAGAFAAAQAQQPDAPAPYGVRDALRAATVGGALAAGLPDEIGKLVVGARADLTLLSLDRLRPVASHLGAAVAYASVADVDTVVVDGVLRKSGGELVGVDRAALVRDAEASRDRLLAQIGTSAEELRFSGQIAVQQQ
jgi:5-methylthioadenosine/S-adenosylhomocysteine deaminase